MNQFLRQGQTSLFQKILRTFIAFSFIFSMLLPPRVSSAQMVNLSGLTLPAPGAMVNMTPAYKPCRIQGLNVYPDNPLQFDFIVDTGNDTINTDMDALKEESRKLIKYFLASLTVPEDELWVNLSPYEQDRIISDTLGQTEMGRDMLAQDYMLKQLTASLIYPEDDLGQTFWDRVYAKAYDLYGTTDIPLNTFNKVWIMPEKAAVYEKGTSVFIVESHLKVMLEEDFLALKKNLSPSADAIHSREREDAKIISGVTSEIVRDVLIPELEKEVNEG